MTRIIVPRNAEKLLHLAEDIVKKHKADGAKSKLSSIDMAKFKTRVTDARTIHTKALKLRRESEKLTEKFQKALGVHTSQKTTNAGHIIYQVKQIRDVLKGIFRAALRKLGDWGFTVN